MKVCFITVCSQPPSIDSDVQILTDKGKAAGKMRGVAGRRGLGLIRLEHHDKPLSVGTRNGQNVVTLSSFKPGWWPEELRQ